MKTLLNLWKWLIGNRCPVCDLYWFERGKCNMCVKLDRKEVQRFISTIKPLETSGATVPLTKNQRKTLNDIMSQMENHD